MPQLLIMFLLFWVQTSFAGKEEKDQKLHKTEQCRPLKETGKCPYGDKCKFAHGEDDQREKETPEKYKTKVCAYFESDICPYGERCSFIHPEPEFPERQSVKMRIGDVIESLILSSVQNTKKRSRGFPIVENLDLALFDFRNFKFKF